MKKTVLAVLVALAALPSITVYGDNVIRTSAPIAYVQKPDVTPPQPGENWQPYETLLSSWSNVGSVYDCSNWGPDPSTVTVNANFTQTATDCSQDQTRTVQAQERESTSLVVRPVGAATIESRTTSVIQTRLAVGTKETWATSSPAYTEWANSEDLKECTNWTPDPATIDQGTAFTQTATDCKQPQSRNRQAREYEATLKQYRDMGDPVVETRELVNQPNSRESVGTKELFAQGKLYRIVHEAPQSGTYSEMAEVELLNASDNDLFDLYTVTTNQSSYFSGYRASSLVDNSSGSKWLSASGQHLNAWVTFTFPENVTVRKMTIQIISSPSGVTRSPQSFQFQISQDGGSNWTTIKRFSGLTWAEGEKKLFNLAP